MAKRVDLKAKAKRQKIIVAVGGVILLGVLAFQVPRTMKMLHGQNVTAEPTATTTSTTATTTGPIAAPSLGDGNPTAVSASVTADGLSDPDGVPSPQSGQLLAFGRFRSKDPFAQQLDANCPTGDGCAGTAGGTTSGKAPLKTTSSSPARSSGTAPAQKSTPVSSAPGAKTTAAISVNGVSQRVHVGNKFPSGQPTFVLVSLTATNAKISIAGGSFDSGGAAATLKKSKPLTLMNTADGARYVLRLISTS